MADRIETRVRAVLRSDDLAQQLAVADVDEAERLVRSALASIDPRIELTSFGEKPRGIVRELEVDWRLDGALHSEALSLPEVSI